MKRNYIIDSQLELNLIDVKSENDCKEIETK